MPRHQKQYPAAQRRWALQNAHRKRDQAATANLKKYGLTVAQYDTLFAAQNHGCAICKTRDPGRTTRPRTAEPRLPLGLPQEDAKRRFFCVDHDHTTGRVRGLLCHHCNAALGHLKDDPALLAAAMEYLKR